MVRGSVLDTFPQNRGIYSCAVELPAGLDSLVQIRTARSTGRWALSRSDMLLKVSDATDLGI